MPPQTSWSTYFAQIVVFMFKTRHRINTGFLIQRNGRIPILAAGFGSYEKSSSMRFGESVMSRWKSAMSFALGIALILGICGEWGSVSVAAEEKDAEEPVKAFPLPKDADPSALLEFMEELVDNKEEFSSPEEHNRHQQRVSLTMIAVADRLLPEKDLSEDDTQKVAFLKVQGHLNLAVLDDFSPQSVKRAVAAVDKLRKDKRPEIASFAKLNRFIVRIACVPGLSQADSEQLIDDVITEVVAQEFGPDGMQLAQRLGTRFARLGDEERNIAFSSKLAKAMRDSGEERLIADADRIEGQLRQLQLPGKTMEIAGTTVGGDKFDWESYRGKVVLVNFWATYCEPCKEEMKNVLKTYKKYHDKGFDVVSISVDPDPDKLDAFLAKQKWPWTVLYDRDGAERGEGHPTANYYGVSQLPTAMLVDQEGKVISMAPFGPQLTQLLDELLIDKE